MSMYSFTREDLFETLPDILQDMEQSEEFRNGFAFAEDDNQKGVAFVKEDGRVAIIPINNPQKGYVPYAPTEYLDFKDERWYDAEGDYVYCSIMAKEAVRIIQSFDLL